MLWRIRALSELAFVDLLLLRPNERLLAARDQAMASGALATVAHVDFFHAIWFLDRFENERAIEMARRSSGMARRFGMEQLLAIALILEAAACGRLGRRDEMEALLEEALALAGDEPGCWGVHRGQSSGTSPTSP